MGGLTVVPDCLIEDIDVYENSILLLPGADHMRRARTPADLA